jgi:MscS family membrane protein
VTASAKCAPHPRRNASLFLLVLLLCSPSWSQTATTPKALPTETQPENPKDTLGRNSPRGAVLGFLNAARKGNNELAALYLDTPLRGEPAQVLAHQLAVVLDRRLPPRLNQLSEKAEGSIPDPLRPDVDLVGTIETDNGHFDILVERVDRGKVGRVWLFSRTTLNSIPDLYEELNTLPVESILPGFLVNTRLATIPLFQWLAVFVGLPLLYILTGWLGRLLGLPLGMLFHRIFRKAGQRRPLILPPPIRLLLLAFTIQWLLVTVGLSLFARQFWSIVAQVLAIGGCVWLLILMNGWAEHYVLERLRGRNLSGSTSMLRLGRRMIDLVILFAGLLFTLYHFGVNLTAAFAGLGVGGIAVALAAQKTLENVIGGVSLIVDQAVREGDFLKLGDISGTVEDVGLRSTRIRTNDRTLVSMPNGQIANMSLETISARDKFWFHPVVGLRYETTAEQIRSIIGGVNRLLTDPANIDQASVRVRFFRMAAFSLDVEVFAYVYARDWNHFLEIQEELLFAIMDVIQHTGAEIAIPSQTMYLATASSSKPVEPISAVGGTRRVTAV